MSIPNLKSSAKFKILNPNYDYPTTTIIGRLKHSYWYTEGKKDPALHSGSSLRGMPFFRPNMAKSTLWCVLKEKFSNIMYWWDLHTPNIRARASLSLYYSNSSNSGTITDENAIVCSVSSCTTCEKTTPIP